MTSPTTQTKDYAAWRFGALQVMRSSVIGLGITGFKQNWLITGSNTSWVCFGTTSQAGSLSHIVANSRETLGLSQDEYESLCVATDWMRENFPVEMDGA